MDTSKIIKGAVSSGRYTVTAPIVKEDYGIYLQIEGVELPSTYEVDFSNSESNGTSVTMIGNADGVLIPHQFIDTGKDIFAFLYWVGEDYGKTVYKFRIPNKLRPDRTNEEPTPEEQSVIDQAISALNTAVAQTAQDVINADASAQSAQGYAEQAETARNTAQGYASNAQLSATQASNSAISANRSASASANSASQSAQIKADVEDLVDDAQSYAESALIASQASVTARDTAQGYANSASASAQSASGYASQAQTSANTASSKATEASTSAQTASQKATEAAQSAENALSYKNDAESAKTASQTAQGLAESARDTAVSAKDDAESARDDAVQAKEDAESAVASISGALAEKAPVITDTASGAIASFTDGADDLPLKSLVVDINPIQDLSHGDPSPENICPISGWTEVGVEQRGVNVWDEEWEKGEISRNGEIIPDNTHLASKNFISVVPSFAYCLVGAMAQIAAYDSEKTFLGIINSGYIGANGSNAVFNTTENTHFIRFNCAATYGTTYNHDISINYPSTDHSYHPYTGRSITINLGQTVYGGKLDVLSGELVVDRAMVDLGTLNWTKESAAGAPSGTFYTDISDKALTSDTTGAICSAYSASKGQLNMYPRDMTFNFLALHSIRNLYVVDSTHSEDTASTFKTAMSGVQLVYPLATPITVQLSANQINSLYGVNNLWADSGDTEVEYRADTKLYINKKIAEAISALS